MNRRFLAMSGCGLGMLILILDSRQAMVSAQEALELCLRTVIPSLFPFFLLSAGLTGMGGGLYISSFLGGYPVGAQFLARAAEGGALEKDRANRLLAWCSQAGPSFIFGIAASQFPGKSYGWLLWGIQLLSALSVGLFFSGDSGKHMAVKQGPSGNFSGIMAAALRATGTVCGWVVIFRVLLGFLDWWFFFFLPEEVQILASGLLELTNGCLMLNRIGDLPLRFVLCLVFLNFGGLCVVMQTASVAASLDIRFYLAGKLLQTVFAVLYGSLLMGHEWAVLPLLVLFGTRLLGKFRKNSSIPAKVGV